MSYMQHLIAPDGRRISPRLDVETLCSEIVNGRERYGYVVNLSENGIRMQRPYLGGGTPRDIQLEFEVPEVDEVVWAKAAVCFDHIHQVSAHTPGAGPLGLMRTMGVRIVGAASRDLRLLRDYVFEKRRRLDRVEETILSAACYARG
jgi:hypothetical protein